MRFVELVWICQTLLILTIFEKNIKVSILEIVRKTTHVSEALSPFLKKTDGRTDAEAERSRETS